MLKGKQMHRMGAVGPRSAPQLLRLAQRHLIGSHACTLGGGEGFGDHRSGHASVLPQPNRPLPTSPRTLHPCGDGPHLPYRVACEWNQVGGGPVRAKGRPRAFCRSRRGFGPRGQQGILRESPMATPSASPPHPDMQPHQTGSPEHDPGKGRACREAKSATSPRSSEPPPSPSARAEHGDDQVSMPECSVPSARAWNAGFGLTPATLWRGTAPPSRHQPEQDCLGTTARRVAHNSSYSESWFTLLWGCQRPAQLTTFVTPPWGG